MHNYHSSTGMELYLLIDRNDYVINIPVKLYIFISARPLNFRTFALNMHEFMCPTYQIHYILFC